MIWVFEFVWRLAKFALIRSISIKFPFTGNAFYFFYKSWETAAPTPSFALRCLSWALKTLFLELLYHFLRLCHIFKCFDGRLRLKGILTHRCCLVWLWVAPAPLLAFPSTVDVKLQEHKVVFWLERIQSRIMANRQRPEFLTTFVLGFTIVLLLLV